MAVAEGKFQGGGGRGGGEGGGQFVTDPATGENVWVERDTRDEKRIDMAGEGESGKKRMIYTCVQMYFYAYAHVDVGMGRLRSAGSIKL